MSNLEAPPAKLVTIDALTDHDSGKELVYLLQRGEVYRIGRTKDLQQRLEGLAGGSPVPLAVVRTYATDNSKALEDCLIREFAPANVKDSWYDLTREDIDRFDAICLDPLAWPSYCPSPAQPPVAPEASMLQQLFERHGITTIHSFRRRLGVTKQYGWLLWHGKIGLSGPMIKRIHDTFGIPLEELVLVERETPSKRRGPRPKHPPDGGASA